MENDCKFNYAPECPEPPHNVINALVTVASARNFRAEIVGLRWQDDRSISQTLIARTADVVACARRLCAKRRSGGVALLCAAHGMDSFANSGSGQMMFSDLSRSFFA